MKKKLFISVVAVALVACFAIGGTLAWLTDKTESKVNTFTVGDVNIDLTEETEGPYKVIPGKNITKDPVVSVEAGSEACWLFVKVDESANWPDFKDDDNNRKIDYAIADGWAPLDGVSGVYYRQIDTETAKAGAQYSVLKGDKVTVSGTLTKDEIDQITENFTLTFTAYAVQQEGISTPADAWAEATK